MTRLDDYRSASLAACENVSRDELLRVLDAGSPSFSSFVVDHGLGPLWHERTKREEFRDSRLAAEALFLVQDNTLREVDAVLNEAGVHYAAIKGAANRLLRYENPAIRACFDLDLLVRPDDRVRAAAALVEAGFVARPSAQNISRELVLSRGGVDIDLHWGLLREGRLRTEPTACMLGRRRRSHDMWMLAPEDTLFLLLVHPAFAKHLAGWNMGLHRIVDIDAWLRSQPCDLDAVRQQLEDDGVRTAAWATLSWVDMLLPSHPAPGLREMLAALQPGRLRRRWLERWLRHDLSERTSKVHWARLLGFSMFLHDAPRDSMRALLGRYRASRRSAADLAAFGELCG